MRSTCFSVLLGGAKTSNWWIGIALRTDLTMARRPVLFISPGIQWGKRLAMLSTNRCSCAAVGLRIGRLVILLL
jgi:hypothetical protein